MCHKVKPKTEFYTRTDIPSGLYSACITCRNKHISETLIKTPEFYEKQRLSSSQWRNNHPEYKIIRAEREKTSEIKAVRQAYRQSEQGKKKSFEGAVRYRHTKRNLPTGFTETDWINQLKLQNNLCACCEKEFTNTRIPERDHITPVAMGGGYVVGNIQALCRTCNASKGKKEISYLWECT
jgi:5-methylcytosine-specific restriction endonuclease McrA